MDTKKDENNPFPTGSVAASKWDSEQARIALHNRTLALLEGSLPAESEQDQQYIRDMGGLRGDRAGWPKKWCVCAKCGSEWQATGFPAPSGGLSGLFSPKNLKGSWLFPGICLSCDDEIHAVKAPPAKAVPQLKHRADLD